MRIAAMAALLILTAPRGVFAVDHAAVPVTGFESLDGVSMTFDAKNPASKLSLTQDAQLHSEGASAMMLESVSPEGAQGNTYLGASVALPEAISLQGRALVFDAWTTQEKSTRALYVRGYDRSGKCALGWQTWSSPVGAGRRNEITLIPGVQSGGLVWEAGVATGKDRGSISRLEFIIGTHGAGAVYNICLDNVRLIPSDVTSFMDVEKPKPVHLETPLVVEGKAAAMILCPDGEQWRVAAGELAGMLQGTAWGGASGAQCERGEGRGVARHAGCGTGGGVEQPATAVPVFARLYLRRRLLSGGRGVRATEHSRSVGHRQERGAGRGKHS